MQMIFFKKHQTISILTIGAVVLLLLSFATVLLNYGRLSSNIVLHFDAFNGVDVMGSKTSLFGIWFLGLTAMLVNWGLAYEMYHRERVLSYLFIAANVLVGLFTLVIVGLITSIN